MTEPQTQPIAAQANLEPAPASLNPAELEPSEGGITRAVARLLHRRGREHPAENAPGLTPDGRLRTGRLAGRSMNAAIFVLSWPIFIESLLNSLVGLTDTVLAASLGEAQTSAIGAASYCAWFTGLTVMAIGVGSTALISRSLGRRSLAVANAAVGQTLLLQVACSVIISSLVIALIPALAALNNLQGEVRRAFGQYLLIVSLGVPFMGILSGGLACLRAAGDSIRPLFAMVVVNIVNIGASWMLAGADWTRVRDTGGVRETYTVLANPFTFNLGVRGIALGTLLAEFCGAAVIVALLIRGKGGVRLKARRLRPHWFTMRRLVRLGFPNFLEMLGMWAGNYLVVLMVGAIGAVALGSHIVAIRIEAFSFLPGFAMGIAASTLVGQYLGAGSPRLASVAAWRCTGVALAFMTAMGLVFLLAPRWITGLFTSQPAHLVDVPRVLFVAGLVQAPFAVALTFRSALRGAGSVQSAMWITWICTYLFRLPLAFLLCGADLKITTGAGDHAVEHILLRNPMGWEPSLERLWWGLSIEIAVRAALFTAWWMRGTWRTAKV